MEDITLIPLHEDHLETVRNWRNSLEVSKYMFTADHITAEQQQAWFKRVKDDPTQHYFMIEYNGNQLGVAGVDHINERQSSCFWSFYLGDTSVRGSGIGSKVEFNIIEYVFNDLGLNKLRGEVIYDNEKVIRMHEKFGFRREGYLREHAKRNNSWVDVVLIGLLKRDWAVYRPAMETKLYRGNRTVG